MKIIFLIFCTFISTIAYSSRSVESEFMDLTLGKWVIDPSQCNISTGNFYTKDGSNKLVIQTLVNGVVQDSKVILEVEKVERTASATQVYTVYGKQTSQSNKVDEYFAIRTYSGNTFSNIDVKINGVYVIQNSKSFKTGKSVNTFTRCPMVDYQKDLNLL